MNCDTELQSKYCHVCGQRKQRRVASVFSLFGEFISETVDWDSRLWRTLWPLFFKPGHLTKAYMEGRRERYIPPFRLYLISSVVFFLVISFSPKAMFDDIGRAIDEQMGGRNQPISSQLDEGVMQSILEEAGVTATPDEDDRDDFVLSSVDLDDRDVKGVDDPAPDVKGLQPVLSADDDATASDSADGKNASGAEPEGSGQATSTSTDTTNLSSDDPALASTDETAPEEQSTDSTSATTILEQCEQVQTTELGKWERLRPYLYNTCLSFSTWGGVLRFANELIDNLPKTLLILLPLMALINKFLYMFAGRYYVEHLLYYVHNFSFLFLFSLVTAGLSGIAGLFGIRLGDVVFPVSILYIIYYFMSSMRVVYEQGRFLTFIKWLFLMISFSVLTVLVLAFFTLATVALHGL